MEAVNMAGHAIEHGIMPIQGGLLDQCSWFYSLWNTLQSEQNTIIAEQYERERNKL